MEENASLLMVSMNSLGRSKKQVTSLRSVSHFMGEKPVLMA